MLAQVLHQVYGGGILAVIMHHRWPSASILRIIFKDLVLHFLGFGASFFSIWCFIFFRIWCFIF